MEICVVITAFNDEGTLMESVESVLSQSHYPDQIGFAHGPSRDSTEEFAGFYREEFDFVHWDSRISAPECGLMHLRLGSLTEVTTSHVLFLRAQSYLYRSALASFHESPDDPDLHLAPVRFMAPENGEWAWSVPNTLDDADLLRHGPFPPSAVLWRTSLLKEYFSRLQALKLGPFSSLGWLQTLRSANPSVFVSDEPRVETWDFRHGSHDWTRTVYEQLAEFVASTEDTDRFRSALSGHLEESDLPSDAPIIDEITASPANDEGDFDWLNDRYPMVE